MEDDQMRAEAIAEDDGRIIAVGTREEVMKLRGRKTQVIDLKGHTLLPGFVDAHGHIVLGGLQAVAANLLSPPDGKVRDIASLQQTLRDWMDKNAEIVAKTQLIVGFGYDNAQLAELRHPTKEELDAVSKDIPIVIMHQSGHLATFNSAMLKLAGITAESEDPPGGVIQRVPGSREPNGVLEETAFINAAPVILSRVGPAGLKAFAKEGAKMWASFGYTTAEEGRSSPGVVKLLQEVAAEGGFQNDIVTYPDSLVDRDFIKQNQSNTYLNRLRLAGAKLTIDGSPQGFTAWRDRPYYDPVGNYPEGYSGYAAASADAVMGTVSWAAENGIQIIVHSNGERASDLLIAAHRAAQARFPDAKKLRPVLIHGQFLREDQVDSFKELGVIPSLYPMHTFYWGDWHLDHTVGPEAGQNISPTGWVRERGMIFSSHHDAPVAFPDSMRVLDATVTRRSRTGRLVGAAHRVDVITGLKAMTIWPAYHKFEEDRKGSLKIGKLADFVILSADPTAIDPETIDQIKVLETIKEGRTIYTRKPGEQAQARADIAPFLSAMSRSSLVEAHSHEPGEECPSHVILALMDAMANGAARQ
jgi:predicted amidohydrolase YtcJ